MKILVTGAKGFVGKNLSAQLNNIKEGKARNYNVTVDAIYEYAWQEPYVGETKTLDVHMSNLRKKLKQVSEKEYIETIWGIGYRMKS